MSIRAHLNAWLHPRDPLLEAWKDDPFVEAMVVREKRVRWAPAGFIAPLLMQRWGCVSVLAATMVFFGLLLETQRQLNVFWINGLVAIALSIAFAFLVRQGLILLGRHFRRTLHSQVPMAVLVQATGPNPLLQDLWMSGVRGRDMVKALHVVLCHRPMKKWTWLPFALLYPLLVLPWEPVSHVGAAGIVVYILITVWLHLFCVYLRYGRFNPLTSVMDRFDGIPPGFIRPAWEVGKAPSNIYAPPGIGPAALTLWAVFFLVLALIIGTLYDMAVMAPVLVLGLQVGFLLMACLIMIPHRLGPGAYFHERLEDALHIADLEFDRHMREKIIRDPDAGRKA